MNGQRNTERMVQDTTLQEREPARMGLYGQLARLERRFAVTVSRRRAAMTTLIRRYFVCVNGHDGEEVACDDDEPYSSQWDSIRTTGLVNNGRDSHGYASYTCKTCGELMSETGKR